MKKYIISNCPACREYNIFGKDTEACCYDWHKYCKEVDAEHCVLKEIVDEVSELYKTSEYFEKLEETKDEGKFLIEYAWHNVAHLVLSKLKIKEIEDEDSKEQKDKDRE